MKRSSRLRASGVLPALVGVGLSCMLLGAASDARTCCPDEACRAIVESTCCDHSPSIPSAPAGTPPLINDRVECLTPRWAEISRIASASRESVVAFGIRTTVLRL